MTAPAASESLPYVELRGISKRFGGVQALSEIDMSIERGEIHALVGENGAGKSTLGKILAGVHRADEGELVVEGTHADFRSPREALHAGITMIAQEPTLVPHRSVIDNVFLGIESGSWGVVEERKLLQRFRKLVRGKAVTTTKVRLRITQAPVCPAISEFALFAEPS